LRRVGFWFQVSGRAGGDKIDGGEEVVIEYPGQTDDLVMDVTVLTVMSVEA
jgi:hypothetical protein